MRNSGQGSTGGKNIALLAGATGLVGREILRLLSRDPMIAEVRALVRRPIPEQDKGPRVKECIADFERLREQPDWFKTDLVFCALGSTLARCAGITGRIRTGSCRA